MPPSSISQETSPVDWWAAAFTPCAQQPHLNGNTERKRSLKSLFLPIRAPVPWNQGLLTSTPPKGSVSKYSHINSPVQFSSVAQSYPTLCDPMDCSTPGLPVLHRLLQFTQTRVTELVDAIHPSHPLSPPSPPALSLSQLQGLFK